MKLLVHRTSFFLFVVAVGVALSGYLREAVLAHLFGAGTDMDAFYFTYGIVQTIHDLLFSGVLSATVVPLLHTLEEENGTNWKSKNLVVTMAAGVALISSLTCLVLIFSLPLLLDLLAPGMSQDARALSLSFGRLILLFLPLNALTTLFVLVLNAKRRFTLPALVYLWNNLSFVGVVLTLSPSLHTESVPIASLAGPAASVIFLAVKLSNLNLLGVARLQLNEEFFRAIFRLCGPIVFSVGIASTSGLLMTSHLIVRSFASDYQTGAIAALGYAFRIYEVPLSLIANPAATIVLPVAAGLYARGDLHGIEKIVRELLLWSAVILVPIAALTWGGADLIIGTLLKGGNFDSSAVRTTAEALRGFAPAILVEAVLVVAYRIFYATRRPSRAIIASAASLISLLVLLLVFAKADFIAIPLSLSGSFTVATICIVVILARDIGIGILPDAWLLGRFILGVALASAIWLVTAHVAANYEASPLIPLAAFATAYTVVMPALLPELRRAALGAAAKLLPRP